MCRILFPVHLICSGNFCDLQNILIVCYFTVCVAYCIKKYFRKLHQVRNQCSCSLYQQYIFYCVYMYFCLVLLCCFYFQFNCCSSYVFLKKTVSQHSSTHAQPSNRDPAPTLLCSTDRPAMAQCEQPKSISFGPCMFFSLLRIYLIIE